MDYVVIFGVGLAIGILIGLVYKTNSKSDLEIRNIQIQKSEEIITNNTRAIVDERPFIIQTTPDEIDALKKEIEKNDDNNIDTPLTL